MSDEHLPLPVGLTIEAIEVDDQTFVVFAFRGGLLPTSLTDAETVVLGLVLQGLTTAQIATTRGVTRNTVSSQLQAIYRKLGVGSRTELASKLG